MTLVICFDFTSERVSCYMPYVHILWYYQGLHSMSCWEPGSTLDLAKTNQPVNSPQIDKFWPKILLNVHVWVLCCVKEKWYIGHRRLAKFMSACCAYAYREENMENTSSLIYMTTTTAVSAFIVALMVNRFMRMILGLFWEWTVFVRIDFFCGD